MLHFCHYPHLMSIHYYKYNYTMVHDETIVCYKQSIDKALVPHHMIFEVHEAQRDYK